MAREGDLKLDRTIELEVEPATVDTFKVFLESGTGRVMHYSCFGHPTQILAFENGEGDLDTSMNVDMLKTKNTCIKRSFKLGHVSTSTRPSATALPGSQVSGAL
jgi:hypothetical protein